MQTILFYAKNCFIVIFSFFKRTNEVKVEIPEITANTNTSVSSTIKTISVLLPVVTYLPTFSDFYASMVSEKREDAISMCKSPLFIHIDWNSE